MGYGQAVGAGAGGDYEANAKQAVESPISRELNVLAQCIAELEQVVSSLGARLQPVTIPQPPKQTSNMVDKDRPAPACGVVGDDIAASSQRVRELQHRVMEIRDCLAI